MFVLFAGRYSAYSVHRAAQIAAQAESVPVVSEKPVSSSSGTTIKFVSRPSATVGAPAADSLTASPVASTSGFAAGVQRSDAMDLDPRESSVAYSTGGVI